MLSNEMQDFIEIAKSLSEKLNTNVSIHPRINVVGKDVNIEYCHFTAVLFGEKNEVDCLLEKQFCESGFRKKLRVTDEDVWTELSKECVSISIGRPFN